ncbi:MAG: oligosaccharide flippase family protein [Aquihabitans sp.]
MPEPDTFPVEPRATPASSSAVDEEAPTTDRGFGRLVRHSALYATGAALGKVIGLLLLPIVARSLTTTEFGRVDLLTSIQSAGASLLLLGMDLAATRLFADLNETSKQRLFPTWLSMVATLGTAAIVGMVVVAAPLSRWLFGDGDYATALVLAAVAMLANAVGLVALTALRNHQRPVAFALVSGGNLLVNGILIVVLVPSHPTATTVLFSLAASMTFGALAGTVLAISYFRGRPQASIGRRLLILGLPLAPAVAAMWIAEVVNRTVLIRSTSASEAAFFSVATRFSSVVVLVVLGFQMAWEPAAFGSAHDDEDLAHIAQDGRRIMTGVGLAVVLAAVTAPEVVRIIGGSAYGPAIRPIGLSLVFALGYGGYMVATMPSALSRHMRDLGIAASVAAVTGIVLNLWMARWGASGTAGAVAAGQFVGLALAVYLGRQRAPVPYLWLRMSGLVLVAAGVATLATWPSGGASVALRVVLAVGFIAVFTVEGSLRDLSGALTERFVRRPTG